MNKKNPKDIIEAQYMCETDVACCSNNAKCSRKIAYFNGKEVLNQCILCQTS